MFGSTSHVVSNVDHWPLVSGLKPNYILKKIFFNSSRFQELMHEKKTGAHLVGSFTVEIGDQDEASKYNQSNL